MTRRFQVEAEQIAQRFDWDRFGSVIDVGGGDGTLLPALLRTYPGLRGQILTGCSRAVVIAALRAGVMCFGGRERTATELAHLAADCGLELRNSGPVADRRTLLEFRTSRVHRRRP
jgi:hypothetical protein